MSEQALSSECATVIGNDVTIKGELTVERGIRVDGTVEGQIRTQGRVMLGATGKISGDVEAGLLVIEGQLDGQVDAVRTELASGAHVQAELRTQELSIEEGAFFEGQVRVAPKGTGRKAFEMPAPVAARLSSRPVEVPIAEAVGSNGNG
ncbi:MAG: hypothetical protein AMXMBFR7_09400 [Planctomycetota bacterium]